MQTKTIMLDDVLKVVDKYIESKMEESRDHIVTASKLWGTFEKKEYKIYAGQAKECANYLRLLKQQLEKM